MGSSMIYPLTDGSTGCSLSLHSELAIYLKRTTTTQMQMQMRMRTTMTMRMRVTMMRNGQHINTSVVTMVERSPNEHEARDEGDTRKTTSNSMYYTNHNSNCSSHPAGLLLLQGYHCRLLLLLRDQGYDLLHTGISTSCLEGLVYAQHVPFGEWLPLPRGALVTRKTNKQKVLII